MANYDVGFPIHTFPPPKKSEELKPLKPESVPKAVDDSVYSEETGCDLIKIFKKCLCLGD